MSLNSINTNQAAYVALQSLNSTNSALQATQKAISTGYRVSDATDDGGAFAIAERVRSDVGALTTVNQQLGNAKGFVGTAVQSLTDISSQLKVVRSTLNDLGSNLLQGQDRKDKITTLQNTLTQIKSSIQDSSYNGKTLIGSLTGSVGKFGGATLIRNEAGSTYGIATFGGGALFGSLTFTGTQLNSATLSGALATAGGVVLNKTNDVANALNNYGAASNFIDHQTTFNSNKIDALNSGLGSLIDADLTKEAARLQSLQIKQQLGTQALSLANQAPSSLISLFK